MTHARSQIRSAIIPLITGLTTTGSNVYDSRGYEVEQVSIPFWAVYTGSEEAEVADGSGALQREVEVICEGVVRELDGQAAHAKLDTMLEELETALSRNAVKSAVGGIKGWGLDSVEYLVELDDTDRLLAHVAVTFRCVYFTEDGAPGAFG